MPRDIIRRLRESRLNTQDPVIIGYAVGQLADKNFYTDLEDLKSDLEYLGCEVTDINEEHVTAFIGDNEYSMELSGSRSFVIASNELL